MGATTRLSSASVRIDIGTGTANAWDDAYALWLTSRDAGALQMPRSKARRSDARLEVVMTAAARREEVELDEALQMPREILF